MTRQEFDNLPMERKAEIVSELLNFDFFGDGDTHCGKRADGLYHYDSSVVDDLAFENESHMVESFLVQVGASELEEQFESELEFYQA